MKEIQLLKIMSHNNIIRYIDSIERDSILYIILEYAEKGSLDRLWQRYLIEEQTIACFIKQVLEGLSYLHSNQIVHRDIKGANILISGDGVVKLTDFGIATSMSDDHTQSFTGTPFWMSPEAIN